MTTRDIDKFDPNETLSFDDPAKPVGEAIKGIDEVGQNTDFSPGVVEDPLQTIVPTRAISVVEQELQEICLRFEQDSRSDKPPTIEDCLPDHITGINRSRLVERLVALELAMLRGKNESIDTSQYLSRFADHQNAVISAFRSVDSNSVEATLLYQATPSRNVDVSPDTQHSNRRLGSRFQPVKLHAEGGLGAVFLARDAELGRMVALKEIKSHHSLDRSSQDRFVTEAVVTGSLEHPGIVPVYGLGRYQDGRPYYAMRFIKGTSFQKAISQFHSRFPSKESQAYFSREFKSLIRTFIELCSAIYYAHEHGVLHRDIKPDNVMLGKFGETMVVDWGLAKVLGSERKESSEEHDNPALRLLTGDTMVGAVLGTPSYMSPEQANGKQDELTATSDIYSLGATLFTLLTGKRPIDGKSSVEVVLNVRKGNVRRVESIAPHAPRALNSICYKAMGTDPETRYQTAGELVEDVERWLADELVVAHKNSEKPLERFGRWVRRYHTWAVAGAIFLTAFTLLAIVAIALIERSRSREVIAKLQAQESKAEAIQRYQQSRSAIDTWLVGSNDALQFYPGTQSIRKRMLQLAVDDYQKLAGSSSRDPDLELERARALIRLGDIHQIQQQYDEAHQKYGAAKMALASITEPESLFLHRDAEVANAHARNAVAFLQEDKLDDAESEFQRSSSLLASLTKLQPEDRAITAYFVAASVGDAELQLRRGANDRVIAILEPVVQRYALKQEDGLAPKAFLLGSVRASELLGRAYQASGRFGDASQTLAAAIEKVNQQASTHSDDPELTDALASLHVSHAVVFRTQGLQAKLQESLLAAIDHYGILLKAMPDVPRYAENLALAVTDLGIAKQDQGESINAVTVLNGAAQQWQDLLILYAEVPRFHEQAAACEDALAQAILDATDDAADALLHASSSVQTYQELVELAPETPDYRHRLAISRSHAAVNLLRLERTEDAMLVFAASETDLRLLIKEFPEVMAYRNSLSHVLHHMGTHFADSDQRIEGEAKFVESIKLWRELAEAGHAEAAHDLSLVFLTCPIVELHDLDSAVKFAELANRSSAQNARYKSTRAIALARSQKTSEAKTLLDEILVEQGVWVGRDFYALSILSREVGDGKSQEWFAKGEEWRQANQPGNDGLRRLQALAKE